jgi:hypothetical protein
VDDPLASLFFSNNMRKIMDTVLVVLKDERDVEVKRKHVMRHEIEDCGVVEYDGRQYFYVSSPVISRKEMIFRLPQPATAWPIYKMED